MSNEQLASHNIERPECGHVQVVQVRPQQSLADYTFRVVPELREAMNKPCAECAKAKAEQEKSAQESEATKDKTGKGK